MFKGTTWLIMLWGYLLFSAITPIDNFLKPIAHSITQTFSSLIRSGFNSMSNRQQNNNNYYYKPQSSAKSIINNNDLKFSIEKPNKRYESYQDSPIENTIIRKVIPKTNIEPDYYLYEYNGIRVLQEPLETIHKENTSKDSKLIF